MLKGKTVVLGVTGSIAAYKSAYLASALIKQGAQVHVIMTKSATEFVTPLTFSSLTSNRCVVDMFDTGFEYEIGHISLAKKADVVVVAPATANILAKARAGIADDMLTTTLLATKAPILFAPAMNTGMYENHITEENIKELKLRGCHFVEPEAGRLACGDTGRGKMAEPEIIIESIMLLVARDKKLAGKRILVSAGPTREPIDPVRYITNHSTGKMGYALARTAAQMGAEVTLVSGMVDLKEPRGIGVVHVESAAEMYDEIVSVSGQYDIIIMAAAVADFTPTNVAVEKIKKAEKETASIELSKTKDILKYLGENKKDKQFICGFSMETENVIENSTKKLSKKNADMIVANSLRQDGAGFGTDTNIVTIITAKDAKELPIASKDDVAYSILSEIAERMS